MTNYLNKTSTVAWLVIILIAVVAISTFALKKSFVNPVTGEKLEEKTDSFFGKKLKIKK